MVVVSGREQKTRPDPSHLHSISLQILSRTRPHSPVKDTAPDRRVRSMERIQHRLCPVSHAKDRDDGHTHLDVEFPDLVQKPPDPLLVLRFV